MEERISDTEDTIKDKDMSVKGNVKYVKILKYIREIWIIKKIPNLQIIGIDEG